MQPIAGPPKAAAQRADFLHCEGPVRRTRESALASKARFAVCGPAARPGLFEESHEASSEVLNVFRGSSR